MTAPDSRLQGRVPCKGGDQDVSRSVGEPEGQWSRRTALCWDQWRLPFTVTTDTSQGTLFFLRLQRQNPCALRGPVLGLGES